jgi:hypothetical protein
MRYRTLVLFCLGSFALPLRAWCEPLVYERFENAAVGAVEGQLNYSSEVVGYGGLHAPNGHTAVFDGRPDSCVSYGTETKVTSTDFTVEAFVKLARRPRYDAIAADWSEDGDNRSWAFVLLAAGGLRFDVSPDGAFHVENKLETVPRVVQPNVWYHVAAVSEGSVSRIYVNGREVASKTRAKPGIFPDDNANLKIGNADGYASGGPRPLHGCLDEVRITQEALHPEQFIRTREPMPEVTGPIPAAYAMPFAASTEQEAIAWQKKARSRLLELVEEQERRRSTGQLPIDFQVEECQDKGGYKLHKASFQGNRPDTRYPCLLAIPDGDGPFPAMLAIHGHGGSAEAVFDPGTIYHGFGDRFARGGYVVLAPSFPHREYCAMMLWDLMRLVDILEERPDVDSERIGVGGLSMGGEWTMWAAACDTRLKVAVVSGWMCTTEGVFSVPNCACWELPGFVDLMDVCEVHLLIAPRPVLFESAEFDGCFPIRHTKGGFARIRAGYKVFGAEEATAQDVWPAGHEWHGEKAYPFVDNVLGGHAAEVE